MPRDVFVSYSQSDHDCAFEMVAKVEAQGIDCWIAPRDISPAADWAAEIIDAIANARIMILIFSRSSNESPQVRREVERAVHKGLNILPFRIENVLPSKSLEYFLSAQHWMDAFTAPREAHYDRLCAYLATQLGRQVTLPPTQGLNATELSCIERHLAQRIGPLAKHLVKTTALRAAGFEALVTLLAAELDTEAERLEFAQSCRISRPRA
jgi:TIR domain